MSWIERVKNDFIITLGDGSEFRPRWLNAVKTKEYNVTEFNFPEVAGTLVSRLKPKGRKYGLEIYFQGDDHIEESNAFELAADDPRPWVISHPYYDRIVVQPVQLNFDNSDHNVTKITGTILETITDQNPKTSIDPTDKIVFDHAALDDTLAEAYANDVQPGITDINQMNANNNALFLEGEKVVSDTNDFENYFNAFNTANTAITNATSEPLAAIRALQAVVNAPALFSVSIRARFETFKTQLGTLNSSLVGITEFSLKKLFENNAAALVSSMALALVSDSQFSSRNEVVSFIDELLEAYNGYILNLDSIQSPNANTTESFLPSFNSQLELNDLINFTVSNLFDIAIDARQERLIVLEDDDNIITLAHRFYGLDVDDTTLDELIETNEIGLNEYLGLKKGRKIVYFV